MRIEECTLTVRGVLALFWPWLSAKPFVEDDYEQELKVNAWFKKTKAEFEQEYEPEVKNRLKTFRWGVWGSFWFLATAVIVAVFLAAFWHASSSTKLLLGGASIFVFA